MKPTIKTSKEIWGELEHPNFILTRTQHKKWLLVEDEIQWLKEIRINMFDVWSKLDIRGKHPVSDALASWTDTLDERIKQLKEKQNE